MSRAWKRGRREREAAWAWRAFRPARFTLMERRLRVLSRRITVDRASQTHSRGQSGSFRVEWIAGTRVLSSVLKETMSQSWDLESRPRATSPWKVQRGPGKQESGTRSPFRARRCRARSKQGWSARREREPRR